MAAPIRITEADLRSAMAEPRYRGSGLPDRSSYFAWVSQGWRALNPPDGAARGAVWVRPYVREGKPVVGHWRGPPPGGTGQQGHGERPSLRPGTDIQQVQWQRFFPQLFRWGQRFWRRRGSDERRDVPEVPLPDRLPARSDHDPVERRIQQLREDPLTRRGTPMS